VKILFKLYEKTIFVTPPSLPGKILGGIVSWDSGRGGRVTNIYSSNEQVVEVLV